MAVSTGCLAVKTLLQSDKTDHLLSVMNVKGQSVAKYSRVMCLLLIQGVISSSGIANDMHEKQTGLLVP